MGEGIEKKSPADLNKEVEEQKAAMAAKAAEAAAAKEAEPAAAPEAAAEEVPGIKVSHACWKIGPAGNALPFPSWPCCLLQGSHRLAASKCRGF